MSFRWNAEPAPSFGAVGFYGGLCAFLFNWAILQIHFYPPSCRKAYYIFLLCRILTSFASISKLISAFLTSHTLYFAMYNAHFLAQNFLGKIRMCFIRGQYILGSCVLVFPEISCVLVFCNYVLIQFLVP